MSIPICSAPESICRVGTTVARGYQCIQSQCSPCPIGSYGTNGISCVDCPRATWSLEVGSTFCNTTFTSTVAGLHSFYIPPFVTKVNVKLWGGGGGGHSFVNNDLVPSSGGGGGYASCNLTVTEYSTIYYIVGGGGGSLISGSGAGGVHKFRCCAY
jgi:hypothetical protein